MKCKAGMVLLGVALVLMGTTLMFRCPVGAQTALVTDYDNYPDTPQAELGDGCDGTGIVGAAYTLNGDGPVSDPGALPPFDAGDTLTMTWSDVSDACVGSTLSVVIKVAGSPTFNPADNQRAKVPYASVTVADGPGSVTYTLPPLVEFLLGCNYQFDAVVGVPLAVVGPDGSYYGAGLRGDARRSTLVGFRNGAYTTCETVDTTTTTEATTTTTTEATTTTTVDTTTTTGPPQVDATTTTIAPADTTTSTAADSSSVQVRVVGARSEMPVTGSQTWRLVVLAAAAILIGLALVRRARLVR